MTVRFKSKSEYQKSYGVSRSRSASPRRCSPLAGLRSDQMGISREPGLQHRKRLSPGGLAQSCGSLLFPPDPRRSLAEPARRAAPPAASRSRSAHRKEPKPPTPSESPAQPETPAGPRPTADPEPQARPTADPEPRAARARPTADPEPRAARARPTADPEPRAARARPTADPEPRAARARPTADPEPRAARARPTADPEPRAARARPTADPEPRAARARPTADPELRAARARTEPPVEPGAAGKSAKPRPSKLDSRPSTAAPDGRQPSADEVQHALRWRAGLRSGGRRSGSQQSEYHRQFSWKKPITAASPVLTAEQLLHSSSRSVPPFKTNPVPVETEYRRSFQGLAPPSEPRLRKHLEHQRVPLFHTYMANKKRREESEKKLHREPDDATPPPPPQVQRGPRMLTEYQSSFRSPLYRIPEEGGAPDGEALQVKELRQQASLYRHRGWGANFSRGHLSQLVSEHNALWEPTDTTDSTSDPPSPRLTSDLCPDPDSRSTSHVEALDLASRSSNSSRRSSAAAVGSGETHNVNKNKQIKAQTPQSPPAERLTAWGEEEEEEEHTDEEEGRLPTPRLKMLPVQRTHHDLTTPATGGAILVGKLKSNDDFSPSKQRCGSAVSMAAGADNVVDVPVKQKEAWPENNPAHHSSSPDEKPAATPPSKPIRTKQKPPSPVAPPPLVPPPQHGIQGTLRHPDFQHNGELGVRFRELQCSGGGCGSDEDDRLSVMSWRSAASCSMASAVLERAQKRRENFWGKR